jgi:ribosomal protein S1
MSESFAEMLEESIKQIHTGEIVDGTVIDVKEDQIILNIGYKADGIITRNEYSSDPNVDLRDVVKVGDEMQAKVRKVNDGEGQVILSRKGLVAEQGSKKLEEAFENQTVITATVSQVMNGGLGVVVDEARVFIPASLVSDTFVKDLSVYKDKEVSFVITEYNPKKRRIIGDCKKLIVRKRLRRNFLKRFTKVIQSKEQLRM